MPASFSPSLPAPAPVDLVVSHAGTIAPHYRVQVLSDESQPQWKLFAMFADQRLAHICLERLRRSGQSARLIAYRRVPTAA